MKNFVILLLVTAFSSSVKSNDYFKALELFNLRKIEESVVFFKKVANDEQNEKRSDAMFNLAVIYDNGFGVAQDKTRALYYYESSETYQIFTLNIIWDGNIIMERMFIKM